MEFGKRPALVKEKYQRTVEAFNNIARELAARPADGTEENSLVLHCGEVEISVPFSSTIILNLAGKLESEGIDLADFVGTRSQEGITTEHFFFAPAFTIKDRGLKKLSESVSFWRSLEDDS